MRAIRKFDEFIKENIVKKQGIGAKKTKSLKY